MHPLAARIVPLSVLCLIPALASAQQPGNANARAEAHATAQGGQSHTSTHRVVVVNGKTIVDERTENGRPAAGGGGARPPMPAPLPGSVSAEEMLRQLQEQVERQLAEQAGAQPAPKPLPPARPELQPGTGHKPLPPKGPAPKPVPPAPRKA